MPDLLDKVISQSLMGTASPNRNARQVPHQSNALPQREGFSLRNCISQKLVRRLTFALRVLADKMILPSAATV